MEEYFAKNREREERKIMDERFQRYLNGLWLLQSFEDDSPQAEEMPRKGKLEGQALRDYLREKGVEL